jgi:MFS family permease
MSTASDSTTASISPLQVPAFRALLLAQSCFGVAFSTFMILPKFLAVNLGAGPSQVGWIMAVASLANVVAVRPVSALAGRWGGARTLAFGCLLMAAGALGFVAVDSVGPFAFFCRALQGLGWAFMFSSSGQVVLALAPPGRLSQAIALHGSSNLLTNAIGPALAEPGIALVGPGPVFAGAAAVAVVGAWRCTRIHVPALRPAEERLPVIVPAGARPADGGPPRLPRFLMFLGVMVGIGSGTMFTFHQPFALGLGAARISDFLVAYTIGAVGIRIAFGRLIDRVGARRVAFASFLLYGVVIASMMAMRPGTLALHGAVFGLAHGLFWPSFLALLLQTSHPAIRHRSLAWVNAAYNAGVVSVAGLGLVAERAGYGLVFVPVGVLVTLAALGLRRPRG